MSDAMGMAAADACATVLDVMADDDVSFEPGSQDYENYREILRGLCKDFGMQYLYAYHVDPANETITYVICVAADDAEDERAARERSYGTVVHTKASDQELRTLRGETVSNALLIDNQFGTMLAWFDKVDGWGGDVIAGADYSLTKQRARIQRVALFTIAGFVLTLLILLFVQMFLLRKHVFNPIHLISQRMKAFSSEKKVEAEPLGIDSRDEIGEIAHAFEDMASDIGTYVSDIKRMATERAQTDVELNVARRIQQGMVPEHMETSGNGFDAFAMSRPARLVGGDFYDFCELDGGHVAAVVGDVSGKGIGAALYMSLAQTIIRDGLFMGLGPAEVLNILNERLCESNPESMFVTALICVFDIESGTVHMANAGHMPPIIIGREVRELDVDPGVLLGLFDDAIIEGTSFTLQTSESMLLYTDGVTEAANEKKLFFGSDGLLQCLQSAVPLENAGAVVDTVAKSVESFVSGFEQSDDLTLLALRRNPYSDAADLKESNYRKMLPADMDSLDVLRDEIMDKASDRAFGLRICLACEEAFVNIVSYSGAQNIWASVEREGQGLHVVLEDDGVAFDPFANDKQEKQFDDLDEGGMGIGIIRDMARKTSYSRVDGRNVLDLLF